MLKPDNGIIYAPWEKTFSKILTPFEEFIHKQTTSGLILMMTTILALLLANSPFSEAYTHFIHAPMALKIGDWQLTMTLHHFVNDGLMAIFFFVVGLELKREFLVGELSNIRHAALPVIAAIGGMIVPALIYLSFNFNNPQAAQGWGIPMATDIAFAVGILVLLADRVPKGLITFLVALAIADDLGAVLIIALFYTQEISAPWLLAGLLLTLSLITLNYVGVRKVTPYFIVAVFLWYALLQSGVHATLAGVIGAFCIPARSKYDPYLFADHVRQKLEVFDLQRKPESNILSDGQLYGIATEVERSACDVQTLLQRLEHFWHIPVAFMVIPIFAIVNAGIPIDISTVSNTLTHPVLLGVSVGLLLGKFIGITLASWIALKLGLGVLPEKTSFGQIAAVSLLGGVGFTMSIFIAELAFINNPEYLLFAKTGILFASGAGALIGYLALYFLGDRSIK